MSRLLAPPKIRSYLDHRPHAPTEMFRKWNPRAYVDHWPGLTDMRRVLLKRPNGYVDHFARTGDMNVMATLVTDDAGNVIDQSDSLEGTTTTSTGTGGSALSDNVTSTLTIIAPLIDATGWNNGDTALLGGNTYSVTNVAGNSLTLTFVSGTTPDGVTVIPVGTPVTHG